MLSHFDTRAERDGQTDGQTEFLYQYCVSTVLTHDKNTTLKQKSTNLTHTGT